MSPVAERSRPLRVDVVRRVESGHVLVLESHDLDELVGQIADDQALGWRLAGALAVSMYAKDIREGDRGVSWLVEREYTATLVRGVPGSPLGMDMKSSEEER